MKARALPFGPTIRKIRRAISPFRMTALSEVAADKDPFRILISCVISLRTKDEVTAAASARLFQAAATPEKMLELPAREIEKLIFPAGFYRTKAKTIREISKTLIEKYGSQVPAALDELLLLRGVGRKTANLVITVAFHQPGICVDTHVHRLSNRFGWVKTRTPEQTEVVLRAALPKKYWIEINDLLVTFGQNICQPLSPWCSKCPLHSGCPKIGVGRRR
ncbi:MAG: endonuclease III domain-containing protein [bacterium]